MTTESGAVAGIATAPQEQSPAVRLVRTIGATQGRPLAWSALVAGASIAARMESRLLSAASTLFKLVRRTHGEKALPLELDERDFVSSLPPPLPSSDKRSNPTLVEPDVNAFFSRRV